MMYDSSCGWMSLPHADETSSTHNGVSDDVISKEAVVKFNE